MHEHPVMYCAVAWFVVEADELEFVASIVDIRDRRFRRVVFRGIDEGDWVIALAPEMGAFHELHRSRLFRDIVEASQSVTTFGPLIGQ